MVCLRRLMALLICAAACGPNSRAVMPGGASEQEILDAEQGWVKAMLKGDAEALASYLSDDFTEISSSGRLTSKAALTAALRSGASRYEELEIHDLHVRFPRPDVAVVTAAYSEKAVSREKRNDQTGVYVNTWIRIGNRWQVVSAGVARTSPPPKP